MGNNCCTRTSGADDISLLRGQSDRQNNGNQEEQLLGPPPPYEERAPISRHTVPVFHPSPNVTRLATQLSEDEQLKIAQRIGLIQHLPTGIFDGSKKNRECVICMVEFVYGDAIRFLPCMHIYHTECIDDWLMRSLTCPSCMEPVDAALLTSYDTCSGGGGSPYNSPPPVMIEGGTSTGDAGLGLVAAASGEGSVGDGAADTDKQLTQSK